MIFHMDALRGPGSRTLTVVLSESDWRALRDVEPDAVGWLHERIRERLRTANRAEALPPSGRAAVQASASSWGDDEY
jgi:hypothetical protein